MGLQGKAESKTPLSPNKTTATKVMSPYKVKATSCSAFVCHSQSPVASLPMPQGPLLQSDWNPRACHVLNTWHIMTAPCSSAGQGVSRHTRGRCNAGRHAGGRGPHGKPH